MKKKFSYLKIIVIVSIILVIALIGIFFIAFGQKNLRYYKEQVISWDKNELGLSDWQISREGNTYVEFSDSGENSLMITRGDNCNEQIVIAEGYIPLENICGVETYRIDFIPGVTEFCTPDNKFLVSIYGENIKNKFFNEFVC